MLSIDTATNIDFSSGVFVQIKSSIKSQEDEKEESGEHIGNDSNDNVQSAEQLLYRGGH